MSKSVIAMLASKRNKGWHTNGGIHDAVFAMDVKALSKHTMFAKQRRAKEAMIVYGQQQLQCALQKEELMMPSRIPMRNLVDANLQMQGVSLYRMMSKRYDWQRQPFRTHREVLTTILYRQHKRYFIGVEFAQTGANSLFENTRNTSSSK